MFSLCTLNCNSGETNKYLRQEHKAVEKYYNGIESDLEKGIWFGGESLELNNKIIGEEFSNILDGKNIKGIMLYKVPEKHRVGFDLTFSPDKSVSLLWARMEEKERREIEKSYENAVKDTLKYIEKEVLKDCVRRGKGGLEREKPEELIFGLFQHGTSRAKDPQLHVHAILINTAKRQDGTYGAIQEKALYQRQAEIKKHFDAALAYNFKKDFKIEMEHRPDGVRIPNISEELIQEYSKRSMAIKEQMELMEVSSAKARSIIALDSRKEKTGSETEYLPIWQKEFDQKGFTLEQGLGILREGKNLKIAPEITEEIKIEKLKSIFESIGKQKLSINESEIRKKVFEEFRGEAIEKVEKIAKEIITHESLIKVDGNRFTTNEVLEKEYNIEKCGEALNIKYNHQCNENTTQEILNKWIVEKGMSKEQAAATKITIEKGNIALIYGAAGTGKSFSLAAIKEIAEANNYKIRGLTPTGKAAEGLAEGSGINSTTIHKYLYDFEKGKDRFESNEIIIIDEAGMIGSEKLGILLKHADEQGTKIILVGDDKQLRPIDSGTPFAKLKEKFGAAEILTIRRQKIGWQKEAADDLRTGKINEALLAYEENGLTRHFTTWKYTKEKLVEEYLKEKEIGKTQIILAPTNDLREELNLEIRKRKFENKEIFKKNEVKIFIPQNDGKEKQKEFTEGERIYFLHNRAELGVKNGTLGTIKKIQRTQKGVFEFKVKLDNDIDVTFSTDKYRSIDHGYAATVHKSQGATVDKSYVLMTKSMAREDAYVAMTRHKEEAKIYFSTELISKTKKEMKFEEATLGQKKLHMDLLTKSISRTKLEIEGLKKQEEAVIPTTKLEIPMEKKQEKLEVKIIMVPVTENIQLQAEKQKELKIPENKKLEIKEKIISISEIKIPLPSTAKKEETKPYISPEIKEISNKIPEATREMLPDILYKIATSTHGVKHQIGTYPSGKIEDYQKKALEILKERKYSKEELTELKQLIDIKPLGVKAIITDKERAEQYNRNFVQIAIQEKEKALIYEIERKQEYIAPEHKILLEKLAITKEEKKQIELLKEIGISKIPETPEFKIKKETLHIEAFKQLKGEHKQEKCEWAKNLLHNFKIGNANESPKQEWKTKIEIEFSLANQKIDFKIANKIKIEQEKNLKISKGFGMSR